MPAVTLTVIDVGVLESQLNVNLSSFGFGPAAVPMEPLRKRAAIAMTVLAKIAYANVSRLQYFLITLLMIVLSTFYRLFRWLRPKSAGITPDRGIGSSISS